MSVVFTPCLACGNSGESLETLQRMSYMCDGAGNAYQMVYIVNAAAVPFCGLISEYSIVTRTVNGVDHTGIVVIHNLNKTTGLFLTVTDGNSLTQNTISAEIIDANTIFIMLDGLIEGGFCIS